MTDNQNVPRKSLRIRLPSGAEAPSLSPPMPSSKPAQSKPKSILKNRCKGSAPLLTATEPDPLHSESYFLGPFRTLIASVENANDGVLSMHDITEAYVLLSCRIESQAANLGDDSVPAVAAVRTLPSHIVCAAIRRDVAVAIPGTRTPSDELSTQERLTDEGRSYVRDRSSLCHACLRFLVNFFRFPSLHGLLKLHELAWILKECLNVGLSHDLATINPSKTYSHVITVISNQRLPDSVLRPFRSKLAVVVELAASGVMEGNATNGPHVDGLKAAYCLLYRHGPLLYSDFTKVLKIVLQNLVCPVPAFRELAAKSLAAFAHSTLRSEISIEDQHICSSIIGAFIDKEVQRAKDIHKHDSNAFVLRDFLKLKEDDPQIIQRVTRLLNITSSLLVLSGPYVFSRPNSLKFLVKAIGKTQPFRQREMNQLRAATWSCLVRAYGLLSLWDVPRGDGVEESAFRIVRQEYREDVGVGVIAVLLGSLQRDIRPLDRAQEAVTYLYHLGEMPETRSITATLFRRLLGGVLNDVDSERCTWTDPASIIPVWLTNGSTLDLEPRRLKKALTTVAGIDLLTVRILEADELLATWDSMVEAFQILAIGQLFDRKTENTLQNDTLLLWRALLRVQCSLAPSFASDVVSKPVLSCLATVLTAFLEATQSRYAIRLVQSLTATLQLWKIVNEELGQVWAAAVAGSIYRRLLKIWQFDLSNDVMSDEWAQLSRALMLAAPKRTLEILLELHDAAAERVVWLDMAHHVRFMEHPSKEIISYLLLFPIQATEHLLKDEMDFSYWDILLMLGLMHDEPENIYAIVSEELERALSEKTCSELRRFITTSVSHASRSDTFPSLALMSVISDYLEEAYPPETHDDNELIQIIPALQYIISTFPSVAALSFLKHGLIPWFQDKSALIPDEIYNNDILPLYCSLFTAIRKMTPIEDTMVELADLLAAPFSRERIPEPAVGPIRFKEFWDDVAPTLDFRSRAFPSVLADCVVCLHNAYGCYIPEWLESQLESQRTHLSDVGEIIPPSFDDVESPDFSPVSAHQQTRNGGNPATPSRHRDGKAQSPQVSPSVGEPSAHIRRNLAISPAPLYFDVGRIKKKRRLYPSAAPLDGTNEDCDGFNRKHNSARPMSSLESAPTLHSPVQITNKQKSISTQTKSTLLEDVSSNIEREVPEEPPMFDEDYSTWEIPIASQDTREISQADNDERTPRPSQEKQQDVDTKDSSRTSNAIPGPSCSFSPEHPIDRSQTAPASLQSLERQRVERGEQEYDQTVSRAKLRRTHTTTDVPLDALEKLHARLSEEANYMMTQDLAEATRLTYDVLGILNGKISKKLENRK
ncbi:hypothetical protein A7U60_g4903 [Sanghuangporus baumii]|uniref:Telomere-associated protein Rif1 N-terminal domain-containing protein n=1 Tax=Sanghuangporus baumii TaxID=108892 RepID=A0A9Q5N8M9_SANBA|nr:hypothetical protein A7U60_g4903 [Sanghuangporus baumii]